MDKIRKIIIDNTDDPEEKSIDISFYFEGSEEAFSFYEFSPDSLTRRAIQRISYEIEDFNTEVGLIKKGHG